MWAKHGYVKLPGPRLSPLKLHNMSLSQRPIIPFGSGKPISDCLLLMGGARAGVRELGRMWEGFKEKKGPGRWRGQEGSLVAKA